MSDVAKYGFSDDWTICKDRPGFVVKKFVEGNVTCYVYRPMLSPEERAKRERRIAKELARTLAKYI